MHGEHRAILAGDVGSVAERRIDVRPVRVMLAPHHGSRTSSSAAFVARACPRVAIFSAGIPQSFRPSASGGGRSISFHRRAPRDNGRPWSHQVAQRRPGIIDSGARRLAFIGDPGGGHPCTGWIGRRFFCHWQRTVRRLFAEAALLHRDDREPAPSPRTKEDLSTSAETPLLVSLIVSYGRTVECLESGCVATEPTRSSVQGPVQAM